MTSKTRKSHSLTAGAMIAMASDGGSTRSGDTTPSKRSSGSSRSRSHSVAALVLKGVQDFAKQPVVCISVLPGAFDASVKAVVPGGKPDGQGLPDVVTAGKSASVTYTTNLTVRGNATKGTLKIVGFEPVPFSVAHNDQGATYIASKGKFRYTALTADHWDWRENGDKPTEGKAAEIEVLGPRLADKGAPTVRLQLRAATEMELKRFLQARALEEAMQEDEYDTLHAQVQKAKMQGVEQANIERGEERLRDLRKRGLHISEGCDKDNLKAMMSWESVTRHEGEQSVNEPCKCDEDCPCNVERNCGEELEVKPASVNDALADFGPDGDRLLFEELVAAALTVEEGSVWKAGGKFIFSAFDRNQSVSALTRMLHNHGCHRASKMLLQMVKYSEKMYVGYVTSIQINFHPHSGTYHAQHRDIYSAKQRAGPNCTCSFRRCVGTVCYTVGSSRRCLLETMTDDMSAIAPCCDNCEGRREYVWLNSGDAMFFNEAWNTNHTHGIPAMNPGEVCGPRISVAFLLGAEADRPQAIRE